VPLLWREGIWKDSNARPYIPKSKSGRNNIDNLKTACLLCNSIKSGKSFEEAAPLLLKSITERRKRF
jgi:5-methylcytosine-specific restriction endonuclease McrA